MDTAFEVLSRVLSIFLTVITAITGAAESFAGERYECVSKEETVLVDAWFRSQDVTTDGENWYYSCKTSLEKTTIDGERVAMNLDAIPQQLKEIGIAHIGGISYYDGKIYAGLEDSKVWNYPMVGIYDAETLEIIDWFYISTEHMTRGCPWVAVDGERGLIYFAECKVSTCLVAYDLYTHEFVKTIPMSQEVTVIQGGEVCGDVLYVATNDETQSVWSINVVSGETTKLFDRELTWPGEGEGITVLETEDGAFLHALDVGALFINTYLRHYALPA